MGEPAFSEDQKDRLRSALAEAARVGVPAIAQLEAIESEVEPALPDIFAGRVLVHARVLRSELLYGAGDVSGARALLETVHATYQRHIGDFAGDALLEARVAVAFVNHGVMSRVLGADDVALADFEEVLSRFRERPEPLLAGSVVDAAMQRAMTLADCGRLEEAIAAFDSVAGRHIEDSDSQMAQRAATAMLEKARLLGVAGRHDDQLAVYREMRRRSRDALAGNAGVAAKTLADVGTKLAESGAVAEGISVLDDVVEQFGEDTDVAVADGVAAALINKAAMLCRLDDEIGSVAVSEDVLRRYGKRQEPLLVSTVCLALNKRGATLGAMGRAEDALRDFDDVVRRATPLADDDRVAVELAQAMFGRGLRLRELGRAEDAVAAFDEVVRRFGARAEVEFVERVAPALVNGALAMLRLGRGETAVAMLDEVVLSYGGRTETPIVEQVCRALLLKANTLHAVGMSRDAAELVRDVERRLASPNEPELVEVLELATGLAARIASESTGREPARDAADADAPPRTGLLGRVSSIFRRRRGEP